MSTPFSFVKDMESSDTISPLLPFSPVFDIMNLNNTIGTAGVSYNNAGLCRNTAIVGGNNTQKTGFTVLAIARVLLRYFGSIVFFFDIEGNFDVDRLEEFVDREIGIPGYFREHLLNKRFFYYSRNDIANPCDGTFVHDKFKEIAAFVKEEIKAKKDIYMETPYLGNDGKKIKIITPILTIIDSISEMHFQKVSEQFQEGDVDEGGAKKTRDMVIGNLRRIVYEDADVLGGVNGMYNITVAQVTDIINMTGKPLEKESVFLRQGKKLKAPKSLMRIPQIGHEIIKGSTLKSGTEWMYTNPFGREVETSGDAKEVPELMHYINQPYRNKFGMSGVMGGFIGSQSLGIQEGLTMYDTLKRNKFFGLEGNDRTHNVILYPEVKLGRTTVWNKVLTDKKLERALTILWYLWDIHARQLNVDKKYRISPQELYDGIKARGLDWNDILENTVDYWHTNPDIKKKTVTTMELIKVAIGERDPYWIK